MGWMGLLLVLAGYGAARRRRRLARRPPRTVACLLLLAALAVPGVSSASSADEVAFDAYAFQQRYCAEVAGATSTSTATTALSEVTLVLKRLSETYDETGVPFLLYWRGVLLQCVDQDERAQADLEAFLAVPGAVDDFASLARDARRRLRAMTRERAGAPMIRPAPRLAIGLGGGYQLSATPGQPYHFGEIALDVSVQLYKVLRLVVFARPGFTGPLRHESGVLVEPRQFTTLVAFGVGPEVRWEGPVRPSISLRLQLAPDDGAHAQSKLLAGLAVASGLDIGLAVL